MSLKDKLIHEIEVESVATKKALERVPKDKFDWKPHEKSMSLKSLATHLAQLSHFPGVMATTESLDLAQNKAPEISDANDLVKVFEEGTKNSIEALKKVSDEDLKKDWKLCFGDQVLMQMPKEDIIRKMGMNHVYHHRAQLGVYLRLLDVPVPGTYGPSADDK